MSTTDIDFNSILAELESLMQTQPEGFTIRELTKTLGWSESKCREKVRDLIEAGKLKFNGRRMMKKIDGVPYRTPVYKLSK